jgi:hypothetical protein
MPLFIVDEVFHFVARREHDRRITLVKRSTVPFRVGALQHDVRRGEYGIADLRVQLRFVQQTLDAIVDDYFEIRPAVRRVGPLPLVDLVCAVLACLHEAGEHWVICGSRITQNLLTVEEQIIDGSNDEVRQTVTILIYYAPHHADVGHVPSTVVL